MVLTTVAAVGEVSGDGLALRLRCGGGVAGVRLDVGEDGPGLPRLGRMAELRAAFDRSADFLPCFVQAAELAQCLSKVVPRAAFVRPVAVFDIPVRGLAVEGCGLLGAVEDVVVQVPQLQQRARLPGDISEPHLDRERFPVGILRRFRLALLLIRHPGLVPAHGDATRFVHFDKALARLGMRRQRLRVAALFHSDGAQLALGHGDIPASSALLVAADGFFVGSRRFVQPAQIEETRALFRDGGGRPSFRAFADSLLGHCLEALAGFVQQRQGLFRGAGRRQHAGQGEMSHRQVESGVGVRLPAGVPGALEQNSRAL